MNTNDLTTFLLLEERDTNMKGRNHVALLSSDHVPSYAQPRILIMSFLNPLKLDSDTSQIPNKKASPAR